MKLKARILLVAALFTLGTALQAAQLQGTVTSSNSGKPLAGAEITLVGFPYGAVSDIDGYFFLELLPAGSYEVKASFVGFEKEIRKVILAEGMPMEISFSLKPSVVISEEVIITANRATERETPVAFSNIGETDIKVSGYDLDNISDTYMPGG